MSSAAHWATPRPKQASGESIIRMSFQIALGAIRACRCLRQKSDSLSQAIIRLGAAEPQKPLASRAETLAPQARDSKLVVGAFE